MLSCCSARRRAKKSLRLNSTSDTPIGQFTIICSNAGSDCIAIEPKASLLVGITRHANTRQPSDSISLLRICFACAAIAGSRLKNTVPTAKTSLSVISLSFFASSRKNCFGIAKSKPQPSPVLPSAAIPPRWVIQLRLCIAVLTRSWLASPCIWAIKPKPQLSLNSSGWYKP
ncbi:hypothetical protein D3C71_1146170 [compost metagenome]